MTRQRWTPADVALAEQAIAAGKPANIVASGSSYRSGKAEQQEQIWFMEWCKAQRLVYEDHLGEPVVESLYEAFVGSANGAYLSGDSTWRRIRWSVLEKMGCKVGASDLILMFPSQGYHGMCLEMKKQREQFRCSSEVANAVSSNQTAFLHKARRRGYFTGVAFGWVDAARKTCTYLGWDPAEKGV